MKQFVTSLTVLLIIACSVSGDYLAPALFSNNEKLEKFILNEITTSQQTIENNCDTDELFTYMDNVASKLSKAISDGDSGAQLLKELQGAINMVDLLKVKTAAKMVSAADKMVVLSPKEVSPPKHMIEKPTRGLLDLLNDNVSNGIEEENKHLVHSKKKLSDEAVMDLVEFAASGPISTERFMQFYSDPQWNKHSHSLNSMTKSNKIQMVKDFLIRGTDKGTKLLDQLYMMPAFIEQLPIIGLEVTKLKKAGQAVYDIVRTVRSLKTFWEIYNTKKEVQLKLSGTGRRMLSKVGIDALKWIALRMLRSSTSININAKNISELAGRCAYYLLIQYAPKGSNCSLN